MMPGHLGLPAKSGQKVIEGHPQVFLTLGWLWILFGCVANEWTVRNLFEVDTLGPQSRLTIWVVDAASISWGILTILRPYKDIVQNLHLLFLAGISLAAMAEFTLRSFPTVLGHDFANGIFTKYKMYPEGIYYNDPILKMKFMVPNYRTDMYYYGYRWIHETDKLGFRNPETKSQADIMLLGDSFIYGHGVNIDQTVSHFIEEFTGNSVVNLARQGDTCFQEAYKLTTYIDQFQPRYVLYFFFENDLRDLYQYLPDEELNKFIDTPLDEITYRKAMDVETAVKVTEEENYRLRHSGSLYSLLKERIYLLKIVDWVGFIRNQNELEARISDQGHDINNEESVGWKYTKKTINYMNHIAQTHHAEFIVVPITPTSKRHYLILKNFSRKQSIAFIETETIDKSNESLFLSRDGHFNEKGAKAMARLVAEYLEHRRR